MLLVTYKILLTKFVAFTEFGFVFASISKASIEFSWVNIFAKSSRVFSLVNLSNLAANLTCHMKDPICATSLVNKLMSGGEAGLFTPTILAVLLRTLLKFKNHSL
jgi:hypothetical protein